MPDVDRFQTKLRGRGWRKVYLLACSGAPAEAVIDRILGAAVNVFQIEGTQSLRLIYSKLEESISLLRGTPLFRESLSHTTFDQLSSDIHKVVENQGYSELARLSERAALQTFVKMEQSAQIPSYDAVRQHFMRNLVWELSIRRCLSAAREGIRQSRGRGAQAQMDSEEELREALLQACVNLGRNLPSEHPSDSIHPPKPLFKPKPTTLETLNQPLPVMGESV